VHLCWLLCSFQPCCISHWTCIRPSMTVVSMNRGSDNSTSTYALLLMGDSFCYNSETHNKQPSPALCDLEQTNTPYVLTYSYGLFGNTSSRLDSCSVFCFEGLSLMLLSLLLLLFVLLLLLLLSLLLASISSPCFRCAQLHSLTPLVCAHILITHDTFLLR
jgi:hypothetical protein